MDTKKDIALVVQPNLFHNATDYTYLLEEAINLTKALGVEVLDGMENKIREVNPATFLSKGFIENLKNMVLENNVTLVVINYSISAIQQRNLEKILNTKVLDRNGLIINIFSSRAKSKEGKLQTELASLMYQKSRLVKAWSHLERQRGGGGFIGGPGETQKELDKRIISDKIVLLKKQLAKLKQDRVIQGNARKKKDYKIVALVGYTNAGKSTLFNTLTGEQVFVKDLLFATLDTTMRLVDLGHKDKIILLDTVGFISNLPHQLIEAFKSTLDEVKDASLILHVIDSNQINYQSQIDAVKNVLAELGITEEVYNNKVIEVFNKEDLLLLSKKSYFLEQASKNKAKILVSAINNKNIDTLKTKIYEYFLDNKITMELKIDYTNHTMLTFLYKNAVIISRKNLKEKIKIKFLINKNKYEILDNQFLHTKTTEY